MRQYSQADFFSNLLEKDKIHAMLDEVPVLETRHLSNWIRACFTKTEKPERMASTPLLASGIFDARVIISDPVKFLWVSLAMAEKLEDHLQRLAEDRTAPGGTGPFRILAVSLRGSPFAAAIGLLTNRQESIEIIDHMGPRFRIFEEHHLKPSPMQANYIFVGDFVVGGTELRVAQTYARIKGSSVIHAIVVGSVLDAPEYQCNIGISSLANLGECCPDAHFTFLGQ